MKESNWNCFVCGKNTRKFHEYYMIHNELWSQVAGKENLRKMMCIGCVEEKLGRKLTPADFTDCPLNNSQFIPFWFGEEKCAIA